jgi:hypothetical protein
MYTKSFLVSEMMVAIASFTESRLFFPACAGIGTREAQEYRRRTTAATLKKLVTSVDIIHGNPILLSLAVS